MGFIQNLREKRKKDKIERGVYEYFKFIDAYTPAFTSFEGGVYEMELTRAAINCFATHCSRLDPVVEGANNDELKRNLQLAPNSRMVTSQYLSKIATIYKTKNTAFILPLYNEHLQKVTGFYPTTPQGARLIVGDDGIDRFQIQLNGKTVILDADAVGVMNQYLYRSDYFGEDNRVMTPTLELINANNQGIIEGVKQSASIRFMAKLANALKDKDQEKERKRLVEANLHPENTGGVFLFDQKYEDVKQIQSEPFTVSTGQMQRIEENVFNYFGVNKPILQNSYTPDQWAAYYEGQIEPFAIQASLVHTKMAFTEHEQAFGNKIFFTANRLQFESTTVKESVVSTLFDRGMMTQNMGCDVFQLPHVPGGDKYYIRKEYADMSELKDGGPIYNEDGGDESDE